MNGIQINILLNTTFLIENQITCHILEAGLVVEKDFSFSAILSLIMPFSGQI
jgi:hypothetical protein